MLKGILQKEKNQKLIKNLIEYAENNKLTFAKMNAVKAGLLKSVGKDENFIINLDIYRITYSIEYNPQGYIRHLSISKNYNTPPEEDIEEIIPYFGFNPEKDIFVYQGVIKEPITELDIFSFNLIQLM